MTKRIAIFGNSGSGKSTLARDLSASLSVDHLDLDTLVWEPGEIAVPRSPENIALDLDSWLDQRQAWVIEGCYGRWIQQALPRLPLLIFLDQGIEACEQNCLRRTWEPHKYESAESQHAMLEQLLRWVRDYDQRDDDTSRNAHELLFLDYEGPKERRS